MDVKLNDTPEQVMREVTTDILLRTLKQAKGKKRTEWLDEFELGK